MTGPGDDKKMVCRRPLVSVLACLAVALPGQALAAQGSESASGTTEASLEARARLLDEQEERLRAVEEQLRILLEGAGVEGVGTEAGEKAQAPTVGVMESQPDAGLGRGEEYTDPDFVKSVPFFGSDWRFSFGGYAKVDVIHDFDGTGDPNQFALSTIPVDGDPQPGSYTTLQAKETRFNLEIRDTTFEGGQSRFFVEFDFFDQSNSSSTRLRHAYFEQGGLVAGRTWTTLTELRQLPLLLDFAAGDSLYGNRTEQIRWQEDIGEDYNWAVALEAYNDEAILNAGGAEGTARSDFPRLVGRLGYESEKAIVTCGLSLSQNRWDGYGATGDSSELSWSVVTGARIYTDLEQGDYLGFGASIGDGEPGNILTFANAGVPSAVLDSQGNLENIASWNANCGYHLVWNPRWSSNFALAYSELDPVAGLPDDTTRSGLGAHANLVLQVNPRVRMGVEYMHGIRETVDGEDGTADRLQFSIFYYF